MATRAVDPVYTKFKKTFEKMHRVGHKRTNAKDSAIISGRETRKKYTRCLYASAKNLNLEQPRDLIEKADFKKYLEDKISRLSASEIKVRVSAYNKLCNFFHAPEKRIEKIDVTRHKPDRGFAEGHCQLIIDAFEKRYGADMQTVGQFVYETAVRVHELPTVKIAEKDFTFKNSRTGKKNYYARTGDLIVQGKGGKIRKIDYLVSKKIITDFLAIQKTLPGYGALRKRLYDTLKDLDIHEKGKGWHSFRHAWVQRQILEGKLTDRQISLALGHGRLSVLAAYLK